MRISVIIPTYKPQEYLWRCLDSLDNQTLSKGRFEVVLILNGCKEPYCSDILNYVEGHPSLPLHFIQVDQGGVSNARNVGIELALGEYITFIDDDDYVSPHYLEALLEVSSKEQMGIANAVAVENGKQRPYTMGRVFEINKRGNKHNLFDCRQVLSGPCMKMLHRNVIGDRRYNTAFSNGEDSLFMFKVSDRIKRVDYTSDDAIYYRCYRDNSLFTRKRSFVSRAKNSLKLIFEYTKIYFSNPFKYSFLLYFTRVAGTIHSLLSDR